MEKVEAVKGWGIVVFSLDLPSSDGECPVGHASDDMRVVRLGRESALCQEGKNPPTEIARQRMGAGYRMVCTTL